MSDLADVASDITDRNLENLIAAHVTRSDQESAHECDECGNSIPQGRREAAKGTQHCVDCAEFFERKAV